MEYINNLEKEGTDFHEDYDKHLMSKLTPKLSAEQRLELMEAKIIQLEREAKERDERHAKELEEVKKNAIKSNAKGFEKYDETNFKNAQKTIRYKGGYEMNEELNKMEYKKGIQ